MKKYLSIFGTITASLLLMTSSIAAASNTDLKLNHAYNKGGSTYDIVVHERANVRLGLYVNDKNPTYAIANKFNWATFKGVKLSNSTGKISFTTTYHKNNKAYEKPVNYVQYYSIVDTAVAFLKTQQPSKPTAIAPETSTTTPAPASAPKVVSQPTCTNGSYVNSAGNTVCSPEAVASAPAGATAQCVDGTYSFSQSRRGTCSHHGGVGSWL